SPDYQLFAWLQGIYAAVRERHLTGTVAPACKSHRDLKGCYFAVLLDQEGKCGLIQSCHLFLSPIYRMGRG
ncbi:MAG: hypothetical protein MK214_17125, partial [Thalassotalea sp.]|nr:hypothetical protein [Thalassotalea sp.]